VSAESSASIAEAVLLAVTDRRWFELAAQRWRELLLDHANCEKKAASTALSLIFTYGEDFDLTNRLSRLAREELRHFEQVQKHMVELEVPFRRLSPSRYAEGLRRAVRRDEPGRLLDLLLCGALIEERSCERFIGLIGRLQEPLRTFYRALAESEARHRSLYLRLAEQRAPADQVTERLRLLAEIEAELATSPDEQFRFHSGTPVGM
jgi:tRNA 2-(methylsulfanyl)-N6-isopentenyladenosine37 hydroxylase